MKMTALATCSNVHFLINCLQLQPYVVYVIHCTLASVMAILIDLQLMFLFLRSSEALEPLPPCMHIICDVHHRVKFHK